MGNAPLTSKEERLAKAAEQPPGVQRKNKCGRRDSNPHGLRHRNLNPACLPFHHARPSPLYDGFRITKSWDCHGPGAGTGKWLSCRTSRTRSPAAEARSKTSACGNR